MELQSAVYHVPALLEECIDGLNIQPGGTYVDVTFGGGGHSRAILGHLGECGRLFSLDQDEDARDRKSTRLNSSHSTSSRMPSSA